MRGERCRLKAGGLLAALGGRLQGKGAHKQQENAGALQHVHTPVDGCAVRGSFWLPWSLNRGAPACRCSSGRPAHLPHAP